MQRLFPQLYPQPGWVEHDPHDILSSQLGALTELLLTYSVSPDEVAAIGITNQRETTVVWDRATGEPIANHQPAGDCHRVGQGHGDACV